MDKHTLYPLQFVPIFEYRLWGGRNLSEIMHAELPGNDPIGEAWLLSDRQDHTSKVANGSFTGWSIRQLIDKFPEQLMGKFAGQFDKFPLLLKFLDAQKMLSVQVHPSDAHKELLPAGENGKTEAWVVLNSSAGSLIYAGLNPGTTATNLQESIAEGTVEKHLASFHPNTGDAVLIPSGTVHTLGRGVVVFEIQRNSDVTFRLYDWNHVDAKTGKPRPLQIEQALKCIDYDQGIVKPLVPEKSSTSELNRELVLDSQYFKLWRIHAKTRFSPGAINEPRVLVCIEGAGRLLNHEREYSIKGGEVWLLPAESGVCFFHPDGAITLLEIAIPEAK